MLNKTDKRCHICGGEIDQRWQADHVMSHSGGGLHLIENYLPAHALCNNYRWDYEAEEFQWILKIGVWARKQMESPSRLGSEMAQRFFDYDLRRQNRRRPRLILASSSPRRRELLREAGFNFEVRLACVEEIYCAGERPEAFAGRVARDKALSVARAAAPGTLVLGADTIVVVNGEVLGKPADAPDAARMLHALSGRTHRVTTAVCLVQAPEEVKALKHETTFLTFRPLEEREIEAYISSGEPFDKAGGYGIQGLASRFVTHVEGDYSNVVGLPVPLVNELLKPFLVSCR